MFLDERYSAIYNEVSMELNGRPYDMQQGVDLSQPAPVEKPIQSEQKDIKYKINATGEVVTAGDKTCEAHLNRLHWEMFMMPAPGCENTPRKGL